MHPLPWNVLSNWHRLRHYRNEPSRSKIALAITHAHRDKTRTFHVGKVTTEDTRLDVAPTETAYIPVELARSNSLQDTMLKYYQIANATCCTRYA